MTRMCKRMRACHCSLINCFGEKNLYAEKKQINATLPVRKDWKEKAPQAFRMWIVDIENAIKREIGLVVDAASHATNTPPRRHTRYKTSPVP